MASPIFSSFQRWVEQFPEKTALALIDSQFTYAEIAEQSKRLANGMLLAGIQPGDHIGVLLPNCAEFVILMLANRGHLCLVVLA